MELTYTVSIFTFGYKLAKPKRLQKNIRTFSFDVKNVWKNIN